MKQIKAVEKKCGSNLNEKLNLKTKVPKHDAIKFNKAINLII